MNATVIEKIETALKPFAKGDIEGRFIFRGDSVEFTINSTTVVFDGDGDLIMTVTPRS